MRKPWLILVLSVLFALLAGTLAASCGGDDDDDDNDTGDDDDDTGDDDTGGDLLWGHVRDFQTRQNLPDVTVELLNDATGEPFDPPITAVSDEEGYVEFEVPAGEEEVAIRTSAVGNMDTIQYSFARDAEDEEFLIVADTTISIIANVLGVDLDPEKTHTAGAVYWGDPTDENPIGCATVTIVPGGEEPVHYFGDDGLPTTQRDELGTNKNNGYFVGINSDVAPTTMTATANGNENVVEIPMTYADSVVIQNFYYSKDEFASLDELEPAGCE